MSGHVDPVHAKPRRRSLRSRVRARAGPVTSAPHPPIKIHGLGKVFSSTRRGPSADVIALADIDLTIESGEFVSLVGPSGCGKTTLLMTIAGLTQPSAGSIHIGDDELRGPRSEIAVMFQTPELFPWRTVLRNVMLPIDVARLPRDQYLARARHLIELVGLGEFQDAYPHQLSGGMQQRVALCRVLIADPEIVLMDEPFGALDEFTRERLNLELLNIWDVQQRKTIVFVTHNIGEAVFLSDRIAVMGANPGRIINVLDVDLPRPRHHEMIQDPSYVGLVVEIKRHLGVIGA
jgi:NitT/TauT family transport system ATP-binding protein